MENTMENEYIIPYIGVCVVVLICALGYYYYYMSSVAIPGAALTPSGTVVSGTKVAADGTITDANGTILPGAKPITASVTPSGTVISGGVKLPGTTVVSSAPVIATTVNKPPVPAVSGSVSTPPTGTTKALVGAINITACLAKIRSVVSIPAGITTLWTYGTVKTTPMQGGQIANGLFFPGAATVATGYTIDTSNKIYKNGVQVTATYFILPTAVPAPKVIASAVKFNNAFSVNGPLIAAATLKTAPARGYYTAEGVFLVGAMPIAGITVDFQGGCYQNKVYLPQIAYMNTATIVPATGITATIAQNTSLSGALKTLAFGRYSTSVITNTTLMGLGKNQISAIQVPDAMTCVLYKSDNFADAAPLVIIGPSLISSFLDFGWNDQVNSIVAMPSIASTMEHTPFSCTTSTSNTKVNLDFGTYADVNMCGIGRNKIRTVTAAAKTTITVYTGLNFTGTSAIIVGPATATALPLTVTLASNLYGKVQSIKVAPSA